MMDWQLLSALSLVVLACYYLVRRGWQTWVRRSAPCSGGCACTQTAPSQANEQAMVVISVERIGVRLPRSPGH